MNLKLHLSNLQRNGVTYLAGVSPSKRSSVALAISEKFFDLGNFVPGFANMLVVTTHLNKYKRTFGKNCLVKICSSTTFPPLRYKPDLIWVDDLNSKEMLKVSSRYAKVPTVFSGCKPSRNGLEILVDSREQKPLFTGDTFKRTTLYVGDYTTVKLLDKFHIERKSPEDLYGTITKGHRRFRDELLRAEANGIKLVMVVEAKKKSFIKKEFDRKKVTQLSSDHIEKIINTVEKKYKLEVIWCNSRDHARRYTLQRLKVEQR